MAGPGVTVPRGAEPDRGHLLREVGPATSTQSACDNQGAERQGRAAAISVLPNPFELNRILMLSYAVCTDSSVHSCSEANRSGWRGACSFSAGLDPARNNCDDCFALRLTVRGLEIPHKRDLRIET